MAGPGITWAGIRIRVPEPCADGTGPSAQAPALTPDEAKNCKRVDLSRR